LAAARAQVDNADERQTLSGIESAIDPRIDRR
jgi:hypothetical protein